MVSSNNITAERDIIAGKSSAQVTDENLNDDAENPLNRKDISKDEKRNSL